MKRILATMLLISSVLSLTVACGGSGPLETEYEVTGPKGGSVKPTLQFVGEGGTPRANTENAVKLPWSRTSVINRGQTVLEVGPIKGAALTCRIVVEKKELAKVTGAPGEKVTCKAVIDE